MGPTKCLPVGCLLLGLLFILSGCPVETGPENDWNPPAIVHLEITYASASCSIWPRVTRRDFSVFAVVANDSNLKAVNVEYHLLMQEAPFEPVAVYTYTDTSDFPASIEAGTAVSLYWIGYTGTEFSEGAIPHFFEVVIFYEDEEGSSSVASHDGPFAIYDFR